MAAANKHRILSKILAQLPKPGSDAYPKQLPVLDHLLLGVVQEGMPFSKGFAAYKEFVHSFLNFNEVRVSHASEIVQILAGVPDAETKARRILEVLRFVFETTYAFDLESMRKKPLKQAQKQLSKITGATAFAVHATVQRALEGTAVPLDPPTMGVLARLGLAVEGESLEVVRETLETMAPQPQSAALSIFLSELATEPKRIEEILAGPLPKEAPAPAPAAEPELAAVCAADAKPSVNGKRPPAARKAK